MAAEPAITAEEFERQYCERSGVTMDLLRQYGRMVRRCYCGEDYCEGWQMAHADDDPDDR